MTTVKCVESGGTQNYSCIDSYTVSSANGPSEDGAYQIGATATCDDSGNCQWQTDALGSATEQSGAGVAETGSGSSSTSP